MKSIILLALTSAVCLGGAPAARVQDTVPLTPGIVIDRSITVRPGTYRIAASPDLTTPAIVIRGRGITVDFNGAELAGGPDGADPDSYAGVGLLIEGGSHVTVKNATIRGYKVGVLARSSRDLHLTRNNLSYNWKQRLYSGIEKESLVDWMSYHQNEKHEWLRYGAAIYLSGCDRAEIDHNTIVQGQNGVMATQASGLKIWNNTIQFLSSIGVGLYRVTSSTIMHNRIDWCIRGYSHGFYNRGQDSAGLLMYEQSSHNRVAFNSITHGGDGLFLWAGQSTMDTGKGGSNDNDFHRNDFSHAATNGIEATFSRNRFTENRVEECWHGVWGGYSYESLWQGNRFARNTDGIAIEHGQANQIERNTFDGDETAIRLWQNATQDPEWGYPKYRDTKSRGYDVFWNTFRSTKTALQVRDTADVRLIGNQFEDVTTTVALAGDTRNVAVEPRGVGSLLGWIPDLTPLPGGMDAMIKDGERRGRDTIVLDEWGPYDWTSPKLWPARRPDEYPLTLRVLGPPGDWKLSKTTGATVTPTRGKVGDLITVAPGSVKPVDFKVTLEYRGGAVTSPRGAVTPAGLPYAFSYSRFFAPIAWRTRFFSYDPATDLAKEPAAFAKLLDGTPLKTVTSTRLDYVTGRSLEEGLPRDRVALVAEGTTTLPPGDYTLQVISDDGVRVWVDDVLEIDAWTPHESKVDTVRIRGGQRRFRVHYYEVGGFAELRFDVLRR